jgi:hypothetical protein
MTLPEVMTALVLLAAFAAFGTQVLRATIRASRQGSDAATMQSRFDGVLAQLRRDAWGASRFEAADARTVRIDRAGRPAVTWNVSDEGALVRTLADADEPPAPEDESEPVRREWPDVGRRVSLSVDGGVLYLVEADDAKGGGRRVPLVSQVALASERGAGR